MDEEEMWEALQRVRVKISREDAGKVFREMDADGGPPSHTAKVLAAQVQVRCHWVTSWRCGLGSGVVAIDAGAGGFRTGYCPLAAVECGSVAGQGAGRSASKSSATPCECTPTCGGIGLGSWMEPPMRADVRFPSLSCLPV